MLFKKLEGRTQFIAINRKSPFYKDKKVNYNFYNIVTNSDISLSLGVGFWSCGLLSGHSLDANNLDFS